MMYQKLISFLTNNFGDGEELLRVIRCSNLRLITLDLTKTIDPGFYQESNVLKFKQKIMNKLFLSEIRSFIFDCDAKNIKPVFLKGLFTAADLYQKPDIRISTDIDILINAQELPFYSSIFEKNGYVLSGKYNYISTEITKIISLMHLVFIKKSEGQEICFEVHGSAINPPILFKDITGELLVNMDRVNIMGLSPYLLAKEYNFVFLMLHFFKHLPNLYFQNMLFYREVKVNLLNIHDIALFINKYGDALDWLSIISISKRMMVVKYIYMVSSIVREIYGDIIPSDFLSKLKSNLEDSYLSDANLEYLGLGKFLWLFGRVIDHISELSVVDILKGKLPQSIDLVKITQSSRSHIVFIKNSYLNVADFVHDNTKSELDHHIKVSINTTISEDMLSVILNIQNKVCCFYENADHTYHKDGIEIIIVRQSGIIHRMFTLAKKEDNQFVIVSSYNMDEMNVLDKNSGFYTYTAYDNGFQLELKIPWSFFGLEIRKDSLIPIEIAALISNPVTCKQDRACNVFNNEKSIWDLRGMNAIQFYE